MDGKTDWAALVARAKQPEADTGHVVALVAGAAFCLGFLGGMAFTLAWVTLWLR